MSPPKPIDQGRPGHPSNATDESQRLDLPSITIPEEVRGRLNNPTASNSSTARRRLSRTVLDWGSSMPPIRVAVASNSQTFQISPTRRQLLLLAGAARENLRLILILFAIAVSFVTIAKFIEDELIPVLDCKERIYILESNPPGHEKVITLPRLE